MRIRERGLITESVIDLKAVSLSPVIEVLRRVRNPTVFSTNKELVRLRQPNELQQNDNKKKPRKCLGPHCRKSHKDF